MRTSSIIAATLFTLLSAVTTASGATPGDVTGDDQVDVADLQCTVLASLNPVPPSCLSAPGATDLNCDGGTDVVDIQLMVLVVLVHPQFGIPSDKDQNGNNVHDSCEGGGDPECGDNVIDPGEECDPPVPNYCNDDCSLWKPPTGECGDGEVQADLDEECDDGNKENGDGCSEFCKFEALCCDPSPCCCDGVKNSGEECDDGNDISGDGCNKFCEIEEDVAGISGVVFYEGLVLPGDTLVVLALSDLNVDPFDVPEGSAEAAKFVTDPDFPVEFTLFVPPGTYQVLVQLDIGGDFTPDEAKLYDQPVVVGQAQFVEDINIDLGGVPVETGSLSGTISTDAPVSASDKLYVAISEDLPGPGSQPALILKVKPVSFPYDYSFPTVPVGEYYVIGSLDVGDDSQFEPGPEDYLGGYGTPEDPGKVTITSGVSLTGIDFILDQDGVGP